MLLFLGSVVVGCDSSMVFNGFNFDDVCVFEEVLDVFVW